MNPNKPAFNPTSYLATSGVARTLTQCDKGQVIFAQGNPANAVFYIQMGRVKLTVLSERGKEAVIAILGGDEFLGEECLAGQPVRMATATVMAPSSILRIRRKEMIRLLREEHAFSNFFVRHVLSRSLRIQEDLVDQLFNSSEKRLARALLLLANYGNNRKPATLIPSINQETLAAMIGTTRARVSTFMNKFKKLGFIDYNGGLQVHGSLLNVVLHD